MVTSQQGTAPVKSTSMNLCWWTFTVRRCNWLKWVTLD